MEQKELLKRAEELSDRCERTSVVTATGFLTPAEQHTLSTWAAARPDIHLFLSGGREGCERQVAFFLPFYMEDGDLDLSEHFLALEIQAYFGQPGHKDYMGAILGLGIKREWLGDIMVLGDKAYVFCLPSVGPLLIDELEKVGRYTVRAQAVALDAVPALERKVKKVQFTVKSMRLDAVLGPMFGLSRSAAADLIRMGAATLNYEPCLHVDAPVKEGDILSLRGHGKGSILAIGGRSRKDRIFLEVEVLL